MKFLAIGDIKEADNLKALLNLDLENYAFLLLTGDMAGSPEGWKIGRARALNDKSFIPQNKDPKEYYNELLSLSVRKLRKVDTNLREISRYLKIFAVYGNTDFKSVVEQVQPKSFTIVHSKIIEINALFLVGYNGHPIYPWEIANPSKKDIFGYAYKETAKELNSFKEEEIYDNLKTLTKDTPNNKVLVVTHTPPYKILDKVKPELIDWAKESYGKVAKEGNVGSTGLRKLILEYKPLLSVFGHIHEGKGIKKINGTTCVNVGIFDESKEFVHVEMKNGNLNIEFRRINTNEH